jgi:hypothetical protein
LFGRWRGLLALSVLAVALAALAVSRNWIAFATLLPLIYVLPCAAMIYICMRPREQEPTGGTNVRGPQNGLTAGKG